jgi:hypothetical protein
MAEDAIRPDAPEDESTSSRRRLLRNVALGAAGAAAASAAGLVGVQSASASDPNDFDLTLPTNPHAGRTGANYTGPDVASSFTIESGPTAANNDTILNGAFAHGGTALIDLPTVVVRRRSASSGGVSSRSALAWLGLLAAQAPTVVSSSAAWPWCGCDRGARRPSP